MSELDFRIDKLVDGELNDGEVRTLLLELEAQPEAWRRCALAFVESQTLRRDFAGIASDCQEISVTPSKTIGSAPSLWFSHCAKPASCAPICRPRRSCLLIYATTNA